MVSEESVRETVVGVVLTDDRTQGKYSTEYKNILGVVILPNTNDSNAEELRRIMCVQLACLPPAFTLLTKEGWPVQKGQEHIIKASHIISKELTITIKRQFENPRVGVMTTNGDYLGFVFIQHHWSLHKVRDALNEQLKDINNRIRREYIFVERNGWPVAQFQEHLLTVLDVLFNQHIYIQNNEKKNWSEPPHHIQQHIKSPVVPALPSPISHNIQGSQDAPDGKPKARFELQLSVRKSKDPEVKNVKSKGLVAKPILISYVRAEAAQFALDLKEELCNLGFGVYLDVHEIKTGSDWQDALNYAVTNCDVFVPLITATYGKSRWTNREVKLADVLGKHIIPISFLDHWPPECLAIQFSSTQYISSKPPDGDHVKMEAVEKFTDPRIWPRVYIKRVSKEIAERYKTRPRGACRKPLPPNDLPSPEPPEGGNKRLIVISAHPKQKLMCHELRTEFEQQGCEVWCSTDVLELQDQVFGDTVDCCPGETRTPKELPPIPEGKSVFSQVYNDIANSIEESKRSASVSKADFDIAHERRQLTRLPSMASSDISQVSSLTSERIEQLRKFQQKAKQAGVVVIIVSEAYTKSKTSQQQVFYCEHRKHVVLVKYDQVAVPSWFSMLMGNDMITNVSNPQFITTLKARIKRLLNPASSTAPKDATAEAKMQYFVNFVNKSVPELDKCVFIAGSSKLASARSEEICKSIGKELAKIENVMIITGGCFGAQEIVAKSFYEARENNREAGYPSAESSVIHILPTKDTQDYTAKLRQNPDGTFETVPFGKSIFLGDSMKEREGAVARLFNTCIVIEGGTGAAHEVEEFIWNDHFVIPIISTGGAAGGHYGVPIKILEAPPCVPEADWNILTEKEAAPEDVAKAVLNIILSLKQSIASHSEPVAEPRKFKKLSRKLKRGRQRQEVNITNQNKMAVPAINNLQPLQIDEVDYGIKGDRATRWHKFLHIFSATRTHSC